MARQTEQRAATAADVVIRECTTVEEFDACVRLQREVFGLPDMEISPRRHLVVSRQAGGWTLGAFLQGELVGFVHHLAAVRGEQVFGYSHMMAVAASQQNQGLGARLKWAQRERALAEGRSFIKWTWDPMRARNAHFNLNRLGAVVRAYAVNFYGTDYTTEAGEFGRPLGLDSDRLFAEWHLRTPRVERLARGESLRPEGAPAAAVQIPADWPALIRSDPRGAQRELVRVRTEFQQAFAAGLVCAGFERDPERPRYLFYESVDGEGEQSKEDRRQKPEARR
ncbi:MAG TPA: GNAT family N-acetyltransferase [Pyrinomonadaceae bacterium]|jgi:predicted GNAT superfamily acetyltransferase